MPDRVPLQTGLPTLVPNFYPARSTVDPTGQGKMVMQSPAPGAVGGIPTARVGATGTVVVGGVIHTGDNLNITLTNPVFPGGALTYTYVVTASDTLATAAQNLARVINDDPTTENFEIAADSGGVGGTTVTVTQQGPVGNSTILTSSVTGGGATTTLTPGAAGVFSGGSGSIIPTQNFTWASTLPGPGGSGPMMTFYYGVPQDVPANVLSQLVAQGAPII